MFNPFDLMKKAREVQEQMKQLQDDLAKKQISADAGAGLVTAIVNGRLELVKITIDKSRFNPNDLDLLEDVITSAVAAAQAKAAEAARAAMAEMAANAGIPPGMLPTN